MIQTCAEKRTPAGADDVGKQARACKQMCTAVVHDVEVARVVEMKVEVDVVGPDTQAQRVFVEHSERRQRKDLLPDSESGNAAEVDEVRHTQSVEEGAVGVAEGGSATIAGVMAKPYTQAVFEGSVGSDNSSGRTAADRSGTTSTGIHCIGESRMGFSPMTGIRRPES